MMTIFFLVCWLSTTSYRKGETECIFSPKGGRTHALKSMTDMMISQILLLYAFFIENNAKTNILELVQTCPTYSHSIMLPWFYSTCKSIFLKLPLEYYGVGQDYRVYGWQRAKATVHRVSIVNFYFLYASRHPH